MPDRSRPLMSRARRALPALALLAACDPGATALDRDAALSFHITMESGFVSAADAGIIRIEGPTPRTVSIQPGQTLTIEGLQPGPYTVALEGLQGGQLESFGETTVTVVAGQNRPAQITLRSFIPGPVTVAQQVAIGEPFTVQFGPVVNATSYVVEWSRLPGFASPQSVETTATSVTVTLTEPGTYQFRVRAKNRFGSVGVPSATAGSSAQPPEAPPQIVAYQIALEPATGCPVGFRDLVTREVVDYTDADGDFPIGGPLVEPTVIASEFRFENDAAFTAFPTDKTWEAVSGDGAAGRIRAGRCWRITSDAAYLDFRVRIRDARGNASEPRSTRVMLPRTVSLTPPDAAFLAPGGSQAYVATVRDADGAPVPGNPVNWSSYTGPAMGSITAGGVYTAAAAAAGVDVVYAWLGSARAHSGAAVPAGSGSWWSPCWLIPNHARPAGDMYFVRMTAYAGREYEISLGPSPFQQPSGNPDLYIRLGAQPTTTVFDATSRGSGSTELIRWTAPANGVLWIGIHAATAYSGVAFEVNTTDNRCGFPGTAVLPTGASASRPAPVSPLRAWPPAAGEAEATRHDVQRAETPAPGSPSVPRPAIRDATGVVRVR